MSDGQDKTDDLISELAKLMSSAGEPEARPGPRPVNVPEAPQRPLGIRIPGMDAPVVPPAAPPAAVRPSSPSIASPTLGNAPAPRPGLAAPAVTAAPAAPPSAAPAAPAPMAIRIPGMDRPVPVTPQPVAERPASTPAGTAPAIDFGPLTPPDVPRPSPISDWQSRETPKSPPPLPEPEMRATAATTTARPAPNSLEAILAEAAAAVSARAEEARLPVTPPPAREAAPAKPQISEDSFGFDLSFLSSPDDDEVEEDKPTPPPRPVAAAPASRPAVPQDLPRTTPAPQTTASPSLGDPIADLIAAELDASDPRGAVEPPRMPVERAEAPRTIPSPATENRARPVTTPRPALPNARGTASPAESDRFGVAPMFAPTQRTARAETTPAPTPIAPAITTAPAERPAPPSSRAVPTPALSGERDPMDEIESLIGEAVRVEMGQASQAKASAAMAEPPFSAASNPQPTPEPAPMPPPVVPAQAASPQHPSAGAAPVVPPLNSGFAPRRAALKDTEPKLGSVDSLAGRPAEDETPGAAAMPPLETRPRALPERKGLLSGGMRQLVGMGVAAALLLVAGGGLFWVLTSNKGGDSVAPVLEADTSPVKETPPATPSTTDNQGSVVFNTINGTNDTSTEKLAPADDSADMSMADLNGQDGATTDNGSESELANRKVRTVTVRPDGSIVSGDDAVAGSEALPVDRPAVPDLPGGDVQPSELLASVPSGDTTTPTQPANGASTAEQQLAAVQPSAGNVIDANKAPVVPMPRPGNRGSMDNAKSSSNAVIPPADIGSSNKTASTTAVVTGGTSTYVQLSSQRNESDAADAMRAVQRKLGSLLNGAKLEIRRVDLGSKGVWYRVVLPTNSFQDATQACAAIKANGGDCVPING